MALLLKKAWNGYFFLFDEVVDPKTKSWPLVAKPYQGLTLLGLYLMFVLKWGPKMMKNREHYNMDRILIVYNAAQILICLYIFILSLKLGWGWKYKWICEPCDHSLTPEAINIAKLVYIYYITKIVDLLDTVFFVLRKKFNQISFLHIYHHTGMVLLIWGAVTYYPGGHGTFTGVINSFVHVVMYSYYLMTVIVPTTKNTIWIKKFVTQLQILQFFCTALHMLLIVFKTDCEYPRWVAAVFLPQNLFMLVLFVDFYIKTYIKKPKQRLQAQKDSNLNITCDKVNEDKTTANKNTATEVNNRVNVINRIGNKNNNLNRAHHELHNDNIYIYKSANGRNIFNKYNSDLYSTKGKCKISIQDKEH